MLFCAAIVELFKTVMGLSKLLFPKVIFRRVEIRFTADKYDCYKPKCDIKRSIDFSSILTSTFQCDYKLILNRFDCTYIAGILFVIPAFERHNNFELATPYSSQDISP